MVEVNSGTSPSCEGVVNGFGDNHTSGSVGYLDSYLDIDEFWNSRAHSYSHHVMVGTQCKSDFIEFACDWPGWEIITCECPPTDKWFYVCENIFFYK